MEGGKFDHRQSLESAKKFLSSSTGAMLIICVLSIIAISLAFYYIPEDHVYYKYILMFSMVGVSTVASLLSLAVIKHHEKIYKKTKKELSSDIEKINELYESYKDSYTKLVQENPNQDYEELKTLSKAQLGSKNDNEFESTPSYEDEV